MSISLTSHKHAPSFSAKEKVIPDSSYVPQPHKISLNFESKELELKFRAYFYRKRQNLFRAFLVILMITFVSFGALDLVLVNDASIRTQYWAVRGIQVALLVVFYALSHGAWYPNFVQPLNTFLAAAVGGMNVLLSILGKEPDHGPHMLYFFVVYMFFGLRFLYASSTCWGIFVAFLTSVRIIVPDNSKFLISLGYMTVANVGLMFAGYFTEYWLRLEFARFTLLRMEEQRTNELLQTLLPERITVKLKQLDVADMLIAEEHHNVSILFSDIVGFTSYSASITAREVVNFLNTLYTTFDHLTVVHEVLKVETIGDAYFVASGVLEARPDHADLLANMAFDMSYILGQFKCKNDFKLQVRIGIHTGRVIAGVVGLKVPRYHLFGDSVTVASLMESTGSPNKIQVSETTYELLKDKPIYGLEPRKEMDLGSDRGKLKTYWLTSKAPPLPEKRERALVRANTQLALEGVDKDAETVLVPASARHSLLVRDNSNVARTVKENEAQFYIHSTQPILSSGAVATTDPDRSSSTFSGVSTSQALSLRSAMNNQLGGAEDSDGDSPQPSSTNVKPGSGFGGSGKVTVNTGAGQNGGPTSAPTSPVVVHFHKDSKEMKEMPAVQLPGTQQSVVGVSSLPAALTPVPERSESASPHAVAGNSPASVNSNAHSPVS